jgi:CheY-specific phosphatase CheX
VRTEEWNQLQDIVVSASRDLLASIGFSADYVGQSFDRNVEWSDTISIIGLGGGLRGSLVLSVPADLVRRSHPTQGTESADLADWLSELANLLLGRVKSRLLAHGVVIELSTPLTLSASQLRVEHFASPPSVYTFDVQGAKLHIVFEAVSPRDSGLTAAHENAAVGLGEVVTFE